MRRSSSSSSAAALLGFGQEYRASRAVAALRSRLALASRVRRDGREQAVPATDLVPGDVALLSAGNLIPADARVLEATDFLVTEASLTGESFPVEKRPGTTAADAPISARTNMFFLGSSVRSGTARALVVATGKATEFGAIAHRLRAREPETNFARGVRQFGAMLLRVMFLIVIFVLAVNQLLGRPFVDSMLFAVALAVGLSPELLPATVSITLSAGASYLSKGGVIVRRLEAIENFGSMDVLCTDKTGTITTGLVALADATDADGRSASEIRRLAFLNAAFETGIANFGNMVSMALATLLLLLRAGETLFQTGWFVVSLMTALSVVLVLRTRRLAWRGRPSRLLLISTIAVFLVAISLPYLRPVAATFGLTRLSLDVVIALFAITAGYVTATEALKQWFYRPRKRGSSDAKHLRWQ